MRASQVNAPEAVRRWLRPLIEGAPVRSQLATGWSPGDGVAVIVVGDGTSLSTNAWTRENVRVSVHGPVEPDVRRIASEIDALLLTPGAVPGVALFPGPGLVSDRDDSVGGFIASVTYRVAATRKVS